MLFNNLKQCLSFLLALAMVLSLVPVSALAVESESIEVQNETQTTAPIENVEEATESSIETTISQEETGPTIEVEPSIVSNPEKHPLIQKYQKEIDRILDDYLITSTMSPEEIIAEVESMDWETYQTARWEISLLEEDAVTAIENGSITLDELQALLNNNTAFGMFSSALEEKNAKDNTVSLLASSTIQDVVSISTTGDGKISGSGNVTSATISISGGLFSGKSTTATIKNNSTASAPMVLTFNYTFSGGSSYKVNGTAVSSGGSATLNPDQSITLETTGGSGFKTASIELKDITLAALASSYNVTFQFTSGTLTVGGETVTNGDTISVDATGEDLVASATNIVGWINVADNSIVGVGNNFKLSVSGAMTVKAIYGTAARFRVGGSHLYETLGEAITSASSANAPSPNIILANSGTLPAGDYIIPSGVTLLIPFDSADTLYRAEPGAADASYKAPSQFRTLTMESGAKITVNGEMSVSGKHSPKMGSNGLPHGAQGFVVMKEGSSIVVNGKLYAWGYIVGEKRASNTETPKGGTVTIESGGTVYECFQVEDYRGGDATSNMASKKRVFPMSQYYVQNVQVPMTLKAEAKETGFMSVEVTMLGIQSAPVPFIGAGGLFQIDSGYIVKDYDEKNDRLIVDVHGNVKMSSMTINIKAGMIGTVELDSSNYSLPVVSNMTVNANSGSEINLVQDLTLHPGSQVNIAEDATLKLGTNEKANNIYVYDADDWSTYCYPNSKFVALSWAYDRFSARAESSLVDAKILVNGTLDATNGFVYTTTGGASIYSTGNGTFVSGTPGTKTNIEQATQSNTDVSYVSVTITPAKLKNEDNSYLETAGASSVVTYYYDHHNCEHGDNNTYGLWYAGVHTLTDKTELPTQTTAGSFSHSCTCGHKYTEDLYAAEVNGEKYKILNNALTNVATDGTVTLLHNIDGEVEVSKALTIDRGTYTATIVPGSGYCIREEVGSKVTIKKRIIAGTSVRAGDCLDIYFYIADLEGDDYEARITRVEKGETIREDPIPASKWSDSGNYRRFAYTGIAAKEMTDTVTVTIYDKAGKQVSETTTESIEAYALRTLEKRGGDELNTALVDMLNYGADAQIKFNHNINDLPNADLTDVQKAFATQNDVGLTQGMTGTIDGEVRFTGASVTAGSTLYLNFYFEGITAADKSDYRAVLKYTDHYGNGKERNISGSDFEDNVKSNGTFVYGPQLTGLAVADGRCPVTCEIYKGDTKIAEATASVEGYVNATIQSANSSEALKTVCKSLMKFVDSAHAYFRSLES